MDNYKRCPGWKHLAESHDSTIEAFILPNGKTDSLCQACKQIKNDENNNSLGLTVKEKNALPMHHVYHHLDSNGDVMYVGIGSNGRAFDYTLRRQPDHMQWLFNEIMNNRTPTCITSLVFTNLIRSKARKIEKEHIKRYKPKFNK